MPDTERRREVTMLAPRRPLRAGWRGQVPFNQQLRRKLGSISALRSARHLVLALRNETRGIMRSLRSR
jgi:hypothetical protein